MPAFTPPPPPFTASDRLADAKMEDARRERGISWKMLLFIIALFVAFLTLLYLLV